jgi:hypothetical protein
MRCAGRFLWLPVMALVVGACYKYTPVQSPELGMEVRAQLNAEAAVRRSEGLNDPILAYDGVIVNTTPQGFSLDVLVARSSTLFQDVVIRDTVRLESTEVQSIMQRSLAPGRTALAAVGVGAAAFAVVKGIESVVGGTGDDNGNGPPQTLVVPVFSWTGPRLVPSLFQFGRE